MLRTEENKKMVEHKIKIDSTITLIVDIPEELSALDLLGTIKRLEKMLKVADDDGTKQLIASVGRPPIVNKETDDGSGTAPAMIDVFGVLSHECTVRSA